ncbi:MAG: PAS domain S-box protein, partial [Desulfocucumaceae bacterium]
MSSADFINIFSYSPLPMYILQDGSLRVVNLKMTSLTGYSAEELISLPLPSLVHPEDLPRVINNTMCRLAGKEVPDDLEWRAVNRRGEVIYLRGFYSLVEFDGHPAVLGQITDITSQKKAVEELSLQKAYFQQLFENSPEGIAILDSDDRFVDANRGFERLFQYSIEEIRGRRVNNVIIPENMTDDASALSQSTLDGEIVQTETVRRRKDGSLLDVSILAYPVAFGSKQAGIYVMYSDITERKLVHEELQAANDKLEAANGELTATEEELKQQFAELQRSEQALRESEQKFRQLFHNANDGIILIEITENNEFGRFIEVNNVVCKRLGYPRAEFLALNPIEIITREYQDIMLGVEKDFVSRGHITFETTCLSKGGQKIPFEISGHVFTMNEAKVGLLVARDITERKLSEEKLRTAHQQLLEIIEFLPDATFAVNKDRKIIAWNRAIEDMTGVRKEQIMGMGDYAYNVPFYGEPRPALIDLLFSGDREIEMLYDHIER